MQEVTNDVAVEAIYSEQIVKDYEFNPLIEALPPIMTEMEVIEQISVSPPFHEKERLMDANHRVHAVQRLFQYFQPLEKHLDLEQRISRALRQGYVHRDPFNKFEVMKAHESYRAIKEGKFVKQYQSNVKRTSSGFTIIGLSGIGKTTAIERVLSFYPQLIKHREYKGKPFIFTQISWMKLDCPFDGSLKGLCISFFSQLDRLLGTAYLNKFGSQKNTTDLMLQRMTHLSSLHGIGLLIIDEIQHLNLGKNGGSDKMLNFFVTLVNTIGVPVLLVGTNKAVSVLQSEFRQARRGSGQGDMVWDKMPKDESWDLFVEGMWEYQCTKHFTPFTNDLSEMFYDQSQGIIDIAVKLFMLSQIKAISTLEEKITKRSLLQVGKESLKLVQPMLQALRSGQPSEIAKYEDIRPIDIDEEIEKYKSSIDLNEKIRNQKNAQQKKRNKSEQSLTEAVTLDLIEMDFEPKDIQNAVKKAIKNLGEQAKKPLVIHEAIELLKQRADKKQKPGKKKNNNTHKNLLGSLLQEARSHKQSAYDWFAQKGFIISPIDEVWKDEQDAELVSDSVS